MSEVTHEPPADILEVLTRLDFEEPLAADDPRYVETAVARGSHRTLHRLALKLGLVLATGQFADTTSKHVLFFGHVGSGKTTELRRYCTHLEGPDHYLVLEVRIGLELDLNNFSYPDLLMALAHTLFGGLLPLPWVAHVRDRPGRGGQSPPRLSIAKPMSASGE